MSPRWASHVDANQRDIVAALRGVGATCLLLHAVGRDCPDLLVGYVDPVAGPTNLLVEVKNPARGRRAAESHDAWHARWAGRVVTVWTVSEALEAIGFREPGDAA